MDESGRSKFSTRSRRYAVPRFTPQSACHREENVRTSVVGFVVCALLLTFTLGCGEAPRKSEQAAEISNSAGAVEAVSESQIPSPDEADGQVATAEDRTDATDIASRDSTDDRFPTEIDGERVQYFDDRGRAIDAKELSEKTARFEERLRQKAAGTDQPDVKADAKNPLVRGLQQLLGSDPIIGDKGDLQQSLQDADDALTRIKRENQKALERVNRQTRLTSGPVSPNIVILLADNLGHGDLGCFAGPGHVTPRIDQLASDGMRFTQFYAGAPTQSGSRWSLMNGLMTTNDAERAKMDFASNSSDQTLAEMLWQANYDTFFVGTWVQGKEASSEHPQKHGFDEFFGLVGESAVDANNRFPAVVHANDAKIRLPANQDKKQGLAAEDLFAAEAVSALSRRRSRMPFLLVVSLPIPAPESTDDSRYEQLARLDAAVGRVLDGLTTNDLSQQTVVLLTADTGPVGDDASSADRTSGLRGGRGSLHEGGLRVPLIVNWPGRVAAGAVCTEPAAMWDLLPTCAEWAQATQKPRQMDGQSLVHLLDGKSTSSADRLLYWRDESGAERRQAARKGPWKVVSPSPKAAVQLYNLQTDPGEQNDLAAEHPKIVQQFIR